MEISGSELVTQPVRWSVDRIKNELLDGTPSRRQNRRVLTKHRKLLILEFRQWYLAQGRIQGDDQINGPRSCKIGSQGWLHQCYCFINRSDPTVERADVQRWAKAHKWITQIDQVPQSMEKYWNVGQEEMSAEGRDLMRQRFSTPSLQNQFKTNATDPILQSPVRTFASAGAARPPPPMSISLNHLQDARTILPGPSGMDPRTFRPVFAGTLDEKLPPIGLARDEVLTYEIPVVPNETFDPNNGMEGPGAGTFFAETTTTPAEPDSSETFRRFQTVYQSIEKIPTVRQNKPFYANLFQHLDNEYRVVHRNHWRNVIPETHQETLSVGQIKQEMVGRGRSRRFDSSCIYIDDSDMDDSLRCNEFTDVDETTADVGWDGDLDRERDESDVEEPSVNDTSK